MAWDAGPTLRKTVQGEIGSNDKLTIGSSATVLAGSWLEVVSDGTDWYVTGNVAGNDTNITACAFSS